MLQPPGEPRLGSETDRFPIGRDEEGRRRAAIGRDFEFAVELCNPDTGAVLLSVTVPLNEMRNPILVGTNFGSEMNLNTDLFFFIDEPLLMDRLPVGLRPLDLTSGNRRADDSYGRLQVVVYVRRREDDKVAHIATAMLDFSGVEAFENPDAFVGWTGPGNLPEELEYLSSWDHVIRPLATCPMPGSGEYARVQPENGVYDTGSSQLACGFELACKQEAHEEATSGRGVPRKLALGFFVLPMHNDEQLTQPEKYEGLPYPAPEPEPFGVRMLERMLRGWRAGEADRPYLEWF